MNNRVTLDHLRVRINRINSLTGSPTEPWSRDDYGHSYSNDGCYHLDSAFNGWTLARMSGTSGAVTHPIGYEYHTKAALCRLLDAFIAGLSTR